MKFYNARVFGQASSLEDLLSSFCQIFSKKVINPSWVGQPHADIKRQIAPI